MDDCRLLPDIACYLTGSGLSREEFDRVFGSELHLTGFQYILQQIAQELGLTITKHKSSVEFVELEEDYAIPNTDMVAPAGNAWGSKNHVHFETEEGIDLDGCFIGGYLCQGADPRTYWKVEGNPGVELTAVCDNAQRQTATDVVNRLPGIINAPAGFLLIQEAAARMRSARACTQLCTASGSGLRRAETSSARSARVNGAETITGTEPSASSKAGEPGSPR